MLLITSILGVPELPKAVFMHVINLNVGLEVVHITWCSRISRMT